MKVGTREKSTVANSTLKSKPKTTLFTRSITSTAIVLLNCIILKHNNLANVSPNKNPILSPEEIFNAEAVNTIRLGIVGAGGYSERMQVEYFSFRFGN